MQKRPASAFVVFMFLSAVIICAGGCVLNPMKHGTAPTAQRKALFEYPGFKDQVTGIALSREGRIFVSFPRWDKEPLYSVAEVLSDGSLRPFPNKDWNTWGKVGDEHPESHFMSAQGLFVDGKNILWILDSVSPWFKGRFPKGTKLVGVDLGTDTVKKVIIFDETAAPQKSYLRNVCVDQWGSTAYISDAGAGAIVVTDLESGLSRRVLSDNPSTKAESGVVLTVNEKELRDENGNPVQIHVNGIVLDPESRFLYYHALTAHTLYRIQTRHLNDQSLSEGELGKRVERLSDTGCADGIAMDGDYDLYLTAPEENAVKRYRAYDGSLTVLAQDDHMTWPNSMSISSDLTLYFTVSQFDRMPFFNKGKDERIPSYPMFKIFLAH